MFSCEFYEIFMNTFFTEHLRTTASVGVNLVKTNLKELYYSYVAENKSGHSWLMSISSS